MITSRADALGTAFAIVGPERMGALSSAGIAVIAGDELEALDRAYLNLKEVQGRCTTLLEEARAARREARTWKALAMTAGDKLVDAIDLGIVEDM